MDQKKATWIRRILKFSFIALTLGLIFGSLTNVERGEYIDSIYRVFMVLFGLCGTAGFATLTRSLVKIPAPSVKLLVIVVIGALAGGAITAALTGLIIKVILGISVILGIIAGIMSFLASAVASAEGFILMTAEAAIYASSLSRIDLRSMIRRGELPDEYRSGAGHKAFEQALRDELNMDYDAVKRGEQ